MPSRDACPPGASAPLNRLNLGVDAVRTVTTPGAYGGALCSCTSLDATTSAPSPGQPYGYCFEAEASGWGGPPGYVCFAD